MKDKKFREYLLKEIKEAECYILNRAKENELPRKEWYKLWDIDTPLDWSTEDRENHNYDLGYLKALEDVLKHFDNGK